MLSHLRFHRRGPPNPASPVPEQAPALDPAAAQREHPRPPRDVSPRPDPRPRSPSSSRRPPTLPSIARVASTGSDLLLTPHDNGPTPPSRDARSVHREEDKAGFIGGVALQKHRSATQEPTGRGPATTMDRQLPENLLSRAKPAPPPIHTGSAARPTMPANKQAKSSWFSTPTDLQGPGGNAKRPAGPRLASEPVPGAHPEPQKGRKSLPFLKNPVSSLLMRRKSSQAAVEAQPPPPSYDPRIKGTKVHDFSAPRPKKPVSIAETVPAKPEATSDGAADHIEAPKPSQDSGETAGISSGEPARTSGASKLSTHGDAHVTQESRRPSSSMPVPDEPATSIHTSSSAASRVTQVAPLPPAASASVRTVVSRQLSRVSRQGSVASAIPRHMKSTSSRFSFDMIGAAEQEKLLEERHRQREHERKTSDDPADGDARFDDFDEDFDYDPMMDDDGLEERIPGVNADYEYEEDLEADLDPDNDQENFAGFVFQRSQPASTLVSPYTPAMLPTPRDANGTVIGFAMTKDTTPELPASESPMFANPMLLKPDGESGLGIQGLDPGATDAPQDTVLRPSYPPAVSAQPPPRHENDDIYFDDGLADELDFEHDGTVFDESIFDNNDTDQYGRPIPGAFAQAKEAMQAAQQPQPPKRGSDMTSASGQSGPAHSTGQTSLSAGPQQGGRRGVEEAALQQVSQPGPAVANPELAYQAALAEAAQLAAASGKFRRSSSPEVLAGLTDTNDPTEAPDLETSGYIDDYGDDFTNDFDDFDFDDEAIIAEANASALANDSDGFYGHEFGFYSAPVSVSHHAPHSTHNQPLSSSTPSSSSNILTSENLFQYANGGYFGPANAAGLNRSTSGRVVREPNLTPITERSEYSNRNSVMSFTLPPAIGSGTGSEGGGGYGGGAAGGGSAGAGAGGGRNAAMASPGLAQLALLPHDDTDNMSLSALMRLRNKAWGGSQASLVSSSREGSPRSERGTPVLDGIGAGIGAGSSPYGGVPAHLAGHVRVGSGLSLWSCSEAAEEGEGDGHGGDGGGRSPAGAGAAALSMAMAMASGPSPGLAVGVLPPRPGSAGAVVNGAGAGGQNGLMAAPMPQRPQSLFLPPPCPQPVPSPGGHQGQACGSACSPVLEGEEADADAAAAADGFALAPALPLRARSLGEAGDGNGTAAAADPRRPGLGHRTRGSADSISYMKDEEGGASKWVVERRRTAESGEVEVLAREVVAAGRI